ncbi:MAG: AAA family ATPase [Solirubrobacteraceae bacterium]
MIRAELRERRDATVAVTLELPDGVEHLSAPDRTEARAALLLAARRFLTEHEHAFGRLTVVDGEGEWELALPADPTQEPVILHQGTHSRRNGRGADTPPAPAPASDPPGELGREALHTRRPGPLSRFAARAGHALKDQAERREDELDTELNRRWVLNDTNTIVVASSKGGVGKTTNTVQLGNCLATYLPNQRVCAVDFNVGSGGLQAAVADDRAARHTLFELHRDRNQITRHSLLAPYLSSMPSGLDLLTVPPQPELALEITPEHYAQLFDELLLDTYDVLVLDCAPDITNPVTLWALQHGTQLLIATEQGYLAATVVQHALGYLLAQPAARGGDTAIAVINKVINDQRAGTADETERALRSVIPDMPVIRIPSDLDLRALLDSGNYSLDLIRRRATRLPIKQMALEVCRRLI